ncbi:MAG: dihydroneopterin aldolase [Gammaproteobacteria bacterium]
MDETTLAFEAPHVRAVATGGSDPLDRISVRDHVRDVEIGAFKSERGVTQRIRFNVVLEVSRHTAAQDDDVDKVISYDTIVEAIDNILGTERVNLLETLAERVAEGCLEDARAVRVFVRIEKLDRIPGSLGVEIVRAKTHGEPRIGAVAAPLAQSETRPHPRVVFMTNDVLYSDRASRWIDAVVAGGVPAIICLEARVTEGVSAAGQAARQIGLLSIEQNAWALAGRDPRCVVVDSRTELDWAMKHGQVAVWAPFKIVNNAVEPPEADATRPAELALWLAREFEAAEFVALGSGAARGEDGLACRELDPAHPELLDGAG